MEEFFASLIAPGSGLLVLAGVLLLLAPFMGNLRQVRTVLLLSAMAALVHFVLAGEGAGAGWSVLLLLAAGGSLALQSYRARRGLMTAEERALIEEVLQVEEPAHQRRLLDVITWRDADPCEVLMRQGQKVPPLVYIGSGRVDVEHDGLPVSTCGPGEFLGEMSLVTGEGASATVKVAIPSRIAVFDREGLRRLSAGLPELSRALDRTLNKGLAAKIQRMNAARSES